MNGFFDNKFNDDYDAPKWLKWTVIVCGLVAGHFFYRWIKNGFKLEPIENPILFFLFIAIALVFVFIENRSRNKKDKS